jgi:Ni,Fe-hydrogenase maturation factor
MGCHQLAPELVVPIAAADQVIFVDAAKDYRFVRLQEVEATQSVQTMTHTVDPSSLLQLTRVLYGRCPKGLSLMIPAEDFGFGEKLSDVCCEGMEIALAHIRALALHRCPKNVSSRAKTEKRLAMEAWRFPVMNGIVLKRT